MKTINNSGKRMLVVNGWKGPKDNNFNKLIKKYGRRAGYKSEPKVERNKHKK